MPTISMTEPVLAAAHPAPTSPRLLGAPAFGVVLSAAALILVWWPSLLTAAIGVEMLAVAFWLWARAGTDPALAVPHWNWLRRPATALWLAAALRVAVPELRLDIQLERPSYEFWRHVEAAALVWGGLELLAALPLSRPFSDVPGPLPGQRIWLPVILPAAGFAVLWSGVPVWTLVPEVRTAAEALLLLGAPLAALRAFGRHRWTATLRWLVVADSALAVLLLALGGLASTIVLVLWVAACGGHVLLLAGELRGAMPRRGPVLSGVWRAATWTASASLGWAVLASIGHSTWPWPVPGAIAAALGCLLVAWVTVRRIEEAPERRTVPRADPAITLSHLGALLTFIAGPAALLAALVNRFLPAPLTAILAVLPMAVGGGVALLSMSGWPRARAGTPASAASAPADPALRRWLQGLASRVFGAFVAVERAVLGAILGFTRAVLTPLRDLNTGDAQDYLLFLAAVSVLVLLFPLLR